MFRSFFLALSATIIVAGATPASVYAAGVNNVYYSAAMCSPASYSDGRTDLRFYTGEATGDGGPTVGGWFNRDNDNDETLVCPVPYDKSNTKRHIVVRLVVEDNNNDQDGRVDIALCGQPAHGATFCPDGTGVESTSGTGTGTSTRTVSIMPISGQPTNEPLRWIWVSVRLPDVDSSRPSGSRVSGLLGYRVLRCRGPINEPNCSNEN